MTPYFRWKNQQQYQELSPQNAIAVRSNTRILKTQSTVNFVHLPSVSSADLKPNNFLWATVKKKETYATSVTVNSSFTIFLRTKMLRLRLKRGICLLKVVWMTSWKLRELSCWKSKRRVTGLSKFMDLIIRKCSCWSRNETQNYPTIRKVQRTSNWRTQVS